MCVLVRYIGGVGVVWLCVWVSCVVVVVFSVVLCFVCFVLVMCVVWW